MKHPPIISFSVIFLSVVGTLLSQAPGDVRSIEIARVPNQVMTFRVLDADSGRPLERARLSVPFFYEGGESENVTTNSDADGHILLLGPNRPGYDGFNAFVSLEGYVGKIVNLRVSRGLPSEYVFRLNRGVPIGGVVRNERGQPIEGVEVKLRTPGINSNDPEHIHFHGQKITTDENGQWTTSRIPGGTMEVRLHFVHPDYKKLSTTVNVEDGTQNADVLEKGHNLTGKVIGWDNRPVAGASVREYHNRGSSEPKLSVRTDGNGHFSIPNVTDGPIELVVEAEGNAPVLKEILMVPNMEPILFLLEKGGVFRGRVTDTDGNPISDARVLTDSDNHGRRPVFWITTTDNDGRFQWDSAPVNNTLFWFEAKGFEVIRDRLLSTDGKFHEIILKKKSK